MITDLYQIFMGRFLGGKGRPTPCFVMIAIEGCGNNGQKNSVSRRLFTFYTSNSRCGKCCQVLATKTHISLLRGVVLSQSTFHLVQNCYCTVIRTIAGRITAEIDCVTSVVFFTCSSFVVASCVIRYDTID